MRDQQNDLALINESDLSLTSENSLNGAQLQHILKRTPKQYIKQRPAKGGGTWSYVTAGYVKKCLNIMFGWDWDFEILTEQVISGSVVVKGKLTCRSNGRQIIKTQFGSKEIMFRKDKPDQPLNIGNDFKAAASDCLKKCASDIGIAADVYNADEFKEVHVKEAKEKVEELKNAIG